MARSIHQTLKRVFYKKSKKEINEMCDPNNMDINVIELQKKRRIKDKTLEQRKMEKIIKNNQGI
jgi:hypothetical protein